MGLWTSTTEALRRRLALALPGARRRRRRVLEQDALKHLCHGEESSLAVTCRSVAGALGVDHDAAARVLDRLTRQHLVTWEGEILRLTESGRRQALEVVRAHRIWEQHLAERTGVEPSDWHRDAERAEHELSPQEADRLAAGLGNPVFDPHGDPIPARDGRWPRREATVSLEDLEPGSHGLITHIEDEPEGVFARLVSWGLHAGAEVERLADAHGGQRRLRRLDGEATELTAAEAASLSIQPLPDLAPQPGSPLSGLAPGRSARVVRLATDCRGLERRRLMDLGIVPGTVVTAQWRAAMGDPTAYRVRGSLIALRRDQAARVLVDPLPHQST